MVLIIEQEPPLTETNVSHKINTVTFTANGEYLVSGGSEDVRVSRVQDGKRMATMATSGKVSCLAVSKDGRWIAAGTFLGEILVWEAKTYEKIVLKTDNYTYASTAVDFSPDSIRLVTASRKSTVTVWDIAARQRVFVFDHKELVKAEATESRQPLGYPF